MWSTEQLYASSDAYMLYVTAQTLLWLLETEKCCRGEAWRKGTIGGHGCPPDALRLSSPSVEPLRGYFVFCFWRATYMLTEGGR